MPDVPCYLCEDGMPTDEVIVLKIPEEKLLDFFDIRQRVELDDGRELKRAMDIAFEDMPKAAPRLTIDICRAWEKPLVGRSIACHKNQEAEFNAKAAKGVRYQNGKIYYDSRRARNNEHANRGMTDMDGGYGDR